MAHLPWRRHTLATFAIEQLHQSIRDTDVGLFRFKY